MADRRIFRWPRARQAWLDFGEKSLLFFVLFFLGLFKKKNCAVLVATSNCQRILL